MRNPFITKQEQLDLELKEAEYAVLQLKKRKNRSDKGVKRKKYDSSLPTRYRTYMYAANKRSIAFNLSVSEFNAILMHSCVYCGTTQKIGVDRIDSSGDYSIDNCQPCCGTCNMMKNKYSSEDFIKHIMRIASHIKSY